MIDPPGTKNDRPGLVQLMQTIQRVLPDGGDWCDIHKAHTLAGIVIAMRPRVVVEIGVWMGGSLVPMALALQWLDAHAAKLDAETSGTETPETPAPFVVGIDPWSPTASVAGEDDPKNVAWWSRVDHDAAHDKFQRRLRELGLEPFTRTARCPSDEYDPAALVYGVNQQPIDLLHVDGNHTEQAWRDARRFLPYVRMGGVVVFDDVQWKGGGVVRAVWQAREEGFADLYPLGTGLVMQRVSNPTHPTSDVGSINANIAAQLASARTHESASVDAWVDRAHREVREHARDARGYSLNAAIDIAIAGALRSAAEITNRRADGTIDEKEAYELVRTVGDILGDPEAPLPRAGGSAS